MGYRIQDLKIGESRQMLLSPRMQNPPQRSENGVFWCFGRGVFFVKALAVGAHVTVHLQLNEHCSKNTIENRILKITYYTNSI